MLRITALTMDDVVISLNNIQTTQLVWLHRAIFTLIPRGRESIAKPIRSVFDITRGRMGMKTFCFFLINHCFLTDREQRQYRLYLVDIFYYENFRNYSLFQ